MRQDCIIDGKLDNSNFVNWVPFDGDIANLSFRNLVPVGRQHLQAVNPRVRGKLSKTRFRIGSVDLTAESLLFKIKETFPGWNACACIWLRPPRGGSSIRIC